VTVTSPIRTLGIVGAGRLGRVLAALAVTAGYRVLVSRSGDPAPIARAVAALGAEAVTTADLVDRADAVLLALPLGAYRSLPTERMRGMLVIDAMNYWWGADGIRPDLSDPAVSTSERVQQHLTASRVVKGLGHMGYHDLEDEAAPPGSPGRKAIAIAGDDADDLVAVGCLVDDLGFDPVIAGDLASGIMLEPGAEAFGADVDAEELRAMLGRFGRSQRGAVVARARTGAERPPLTEPTPRQP